MLKSRKKMLLSSIAMLLVALVALGSATFAWYITQETVTAKNAVISAAAATGLEIRKGTSGTWGDEIELDDGSSLSPSSMSYADTWGATKLAGNGEGTLFNDGTLKNQLTEIDKTNAAGKFVIQDFQVASTSDAITGCGVRIKVNAAPAGTYVNYALYCNGAKQGDGFFTSANSTSTKKIALADGETDKYVDGGSQSITSLYGQTYVNCGTFNAGTEASPTTFTLVAFVDGFDSNCKNSTASIDNVDITLEFKNTAY